MTRIDHAGKARQILAEIPDGATEAGTMAWCAEAQVHASLAIAEQQRIANLIALAGPMKILGEEDLEISVPVYDIERLENGLRSGELKPDISAALGLTAGQEEEQA